MSMFAPNLEDWRHICQVIHEAGGQAPLEAFTLEEQGKLMPARQGIWRYLGLLEVWCAMPIWQASDGLFHLEADWQHRLEVMEYHSREEVRAYHKHLLAEIERGGACRLWNGAARCAVPYCHEEACHYYDATARGTCVRQHLQEEIG